MRYPSFILIVALLAACGREVPTPVPQPVVVVQHEAPPPARREMPVWEVAEERKPEPALNEYVSGSTLVSIVKRVTLPDGTLVWQVDGETIMPVSEPKIVLPEVPQYPPGYMPPATPQAR